jgi:acyl carrier protein
LQDDRSTKEEILSQIVREVGDNALTADLSAGSLLMSSGLLDSIAAMRLVLYLERRFSISIHASELTPENFDTVDRILGFVRAKQTD